MSNPAWKAFERYLCRAFGAERTGAAGVESSDCRQQTYPFGLEAKHGLKFPKWLDEDMKQAAENSEIDGLPIPLLVLHRKGTRYDESLVVLRLSDFLSAILPLVDRSETAAPQPP